MFVYQKGQKKNFKKSSLFSADKLQVIAMRGLYGEEVPFFAHLEAQSKSTRWLKLLEGIMKNTMATILQACVQTRMDESK